MVPLTHKGLGKDPHPEKRNVLAQCSVQLLEETISFE